MTCEHAQNPSPDGIEYQAAVWCGLKGDSYSFGCCRECPDNTAKGQWPPASALVPLRIERSPIIRTPAQIALAAQHAATCESCAESTAEGTAGVSRRTWTVTCRQCGCGGLSLVDGECRLGKWTSR